MHAFLNRDSLAYGGCLVALLGLTAVLKVRLPADVRSLWRGSHNVLAVLKVDVLITIHMVCIIGLERREHKGNRHHYICPACAGGSEHASQIQARSDLQAS